MDGSENYHTLERPQFDDPIRILIVRSPFYKDISDNLLQGASAEVDAAGGTWDVVDVPGALEIPSAIGIAERMNDYHGYVALGCVIRGETSHYETVCNDSSRGIAMLGLQGLCIGNGILTVENQSQAEVRADPDKQNKGARAAAAALHLIALARKWSSELKGVGFKPAVNEI
jgi:6,7-dimethyl-8-ribityllumazine synthase